MTLRNLIEMSEYTTMVICEDYCDDDLDLLEEVAKYSNPMNDSFVLELFAITNGELLERKVTRFTVSCNKLYVGVE